MRISARMGLNCAANVACNPRLFGNCTRLPVSRSRPPPTASSRRCCASPWAQGECGGLQIIVFSVGSTRTRRAYLSLRVASFFCMAVALLIAVSHPALGIVFLFLVPFWFVWRLLQDCACASSARLANLFSSLHFFGSGLAHPRLHALFL